MKHNIFMGGNENELFFEEVEIRYLVHRSLIDENTRDMILNFYTSLEAPSGINVNVTDDVYVFQPAEYAENRSKLDSEDFLWFAL